MRRYIFRNFVIVVVSLIVGTFLTGPIAQLQAPAYFAWHDAPICSKARYQRECRPVSYELQRWR